MSTITADMVKQLRTATSAGIMDCKAALKECDGDMTKAVDFLRKKGLATAKKRADRETKEGVVCPYIHMGGKLGVLVEINCETDFVAKTDDFLDFAKNIAMHIAAAAPLGVKAEDISEEMVEKEKEIFRGQALETGKPEKVVEKIVEGKLKKFYEDSCLMNQAYVRDTSITISDYLNEVIAKTGENISIRRFVRYQIGE
ncbi:elongation factor Ts [Candidatus Magnetomorum sp. HK-1]|nr:elongation factor Ts [Candidatus Magnetomorum sp. HK-1]